MKKKVYLGSFPDWKTVQEYFETDEKEPKVVYANYYTEGYEGYASVVFKRKDDWFYVRASHCSCYGLENQFVPQQFLPEVHFKALDEGKRYINIGGYGDCEDQEIAFDTWLVMQTGAR